MNGDPGKDPTKEPILLVLGAGASAPYGFPIGSVLRQNIIHELGQHNSSLTRMLHELGHEKEETEWFRERLNDSETGTIDEFLKRNMQVADIARAAIAHELIQHERHDNLNAGNWYKLLINKIYEWGVDRTPQLISFVTFNYDRSLEHYLFTRFRARDGVDDDTAAQKVNAFCIRHMYGTIGRPPWRLPVPNEIPTDFIRDYTPDLTPEAIAGSAKSIRIPHDEGLTKKPYRGISLHLADYESIHFVGFGYDELNLRRLGITEGNRLGTLFGSARSFNRIEDVERRFNITLDHEDRHAFGYVKGVMGFS